MDGAFLLQHGYKFDINKAVDALDTAEDWLRIAGGIKSVDPDNSEEIAQDYYYDGDGNAETDVIGMQKVYAFSGHRKYGNAAQDFIFNTLSHVVGPERRVAFRITYPDGTKLSGPATIANIKDPGGDANSKGEIEFEIHFAGLPTVTPPEI